MREKLKYFIINKTVDFERGTYEKMIPCPEGLRFASETGSGVGQFITRIFDSGERGTEWHRLTIRTTGCTGSDLRIRVYAADSDALFLEGETVYLHDILHDREMRLSRKLELFAPFEQMRSAESSDVLLHGISGRYIWFLIEIYSGSGTSAQITEVKVQLPSQSWIDYLPQIYRKGDGETHFLERYLAVFQTMYEELDAMIADSAYWFDPECTDPSFLLWLADWIDIAESWLWPEEKLRTFIINAVSLYRRRGTKESLSEIIELYTGEKPFIVEEFDVRAYEGTEIYDHTLLPMYGNDPYTITVLINRETVKTEHDYNALRKIAGEMLPAAMQLRTILLEPYIFAGKFSYLGINSTLGSYKSAAFDGQSTLMLSAIGQDTAAGGDNI